MRTIRIIAASLLLVTSCAHAAQAQPYREAPVPAWVEVASDTEFTRALPAVEAGHADHLLVDHQVRLTSITERYTRYVQRLMSQAEISDAAQISIQIDPAHDRVLLHAVRVFRDNRIIDKRADARRSLLNREQGLEQGLIDGQVTLHLLLQDIRVGDLLDYSYTIERTEPIRERGYDDWYYTQWTEPVRHMRLRVLHPRQRTLYVLDHGKGPEPKRTQRGEWQEILWEKRDIPALPNEADRPNWDLRFGRIELSEFANWDAVREWALGLYDIRANQDAAFDALLAELQGERDESKRILRALRFVQDDIRYTGLEIGSGAWRPSQPATVLSRRYGDCKDKVLLLIALLRRLGVEAHPALVSTYSGRGIEDRLPSPGVFNHVIAKVQSQGRTYWLDATVSDQGGDLDTLVQANFERALVLAPGTGGLETIPLRKLTEATSYVVETYDFTKGTDKTATYVVRTFYRDEMADDMRAEMRTRTVAQLSEDYLNYYRKNREGIRVASPMRILDDRERNKFTIEESYEIDKPFEKNDDGVPEFTIEAYAVTQHLGRPDQAVRTSPLARRYPLNVRHEIEAYLSGEWQFEDEDLDVVDSTFKYSHTARFAKGKLSLDYRLRHSADHVPVAGVPEFLRHLDDARDNSFYTLSDGSNVGAAGKKGPSIEVIASILLGLGLAALLFRMLGKLPHLPAAEPGAPVGLGGWLVLPMIGTVLAPIFFTQTVQVWLDSLGTAAQFQAIDSNLQYLFVLQFVLGYAAFALMFIAMKLLFTKRREFPAMFILCDLLMLGLLAINIVILGLMGEDGAKDQEESIIELVRGVIGSAVWIPYMLLSQRVRATFVVKARSGNREQAALPVAQ